MMRLRQERLLPMCSEDVLFSLQRYDVVEIGNAERGFKECSRSRSRSCH